MRSLISVRYKFAMKNRPRQHEEALCMKAMERLDRLQPTNARIIHIPNGGARGKTALAGMIIGKKLKMMGTVPGVPDYLILFADGTFAFAEAKLDLRKLGSVVIHAKTDLSPPQKAFKADMIDLCGENLKYFVFRTVDEFIVGLAGAGVIFKRRA